jgi:hypothetical protein
VFQLLEQVRQGAGRCGLMNCHTHIIEQGYDKFLNAEFTGLDLPAIA